MAELAAITRLAQPRVSTHLAKLREAGLVLDRRDGVSVIYRLAEPMPPALAGLWRTLTDHTDDPMLEQDEQRIAEVLSARTGGQSWADSVAGDMERHYSPGRTWEAAARSLAQLTDLGEVLDVASGDGALAETLVHRAERLICLDYSEKVVAAGRKRVAGQSRIRFEQGDMHELEFEDASFDTVLLMHALTYTDHPARVLSEACRVLRPGGRLLAATLAKHAHQAAVAPYDHRNLGFSQTQLRRLAVKAGLAVDYCQISAVEKRPPHFAVVTLLAHRPAD